MDMNAEMCEVSKEFNEHEDEPNLEIFETPCDSQVHQPMDVIDEHTDEQTDNRTDSETDKQTYEKKPKKSAIKKAKREDKQEKENVTDKEDVDDAENEDDDEADHVMSEDDKKDAYKAVKAGDIDLLEDILDRPYSDINMTLFNENLLMAAIRSDEPEMAEFLLDNGVNHNYKTALITVNEHHRNRVEWRKYSCRQMAFDKEMEDIVEIIDFKNNDLFPFVKPRDRVPRYRRPKPPTPEPESESSSDEEQSEEYSMSSGEEFQKKEKKSISSLEDVDGSATKLKTRRESSLGKGTDDDAKMELSNENNDNDSGHNTLFSSPEVDHRPLNLDYMYERGTAAFLFRGFDEGYGTMSFKSSMCVSPSIKHSSEKKKLQIPIRGTKSFSNLQKSVVNRQSNNAHIRDHYEKPLLWKKVQMCGSYTKESPLWHVDNPHNIIRPSTETLISKQCHSAPPAISKPSDVKPWKTKSEPHYARLTNSAYTKRKLFPTFTRAYSDLEFVEQPSAEKTSNITKAQSSSKTSNLYTNTKPKSFYNVNKEPLRLGGVNAIKSLELRQKTYSIPSGSTAMGVRNERAQTTIGEKVRNGYRFTNQQFPHRQRSPIKAW